MLRKPEDWKCDSRSHLPIDDDAHVVVLLEMRAKFMHVRTKCVSRRLDRNRKDNILRLKQRVAK